MILKHTLVLTVIVLLTTVLLAGTYHMTKPMIDDSKLRTTNSHISLIFPQSHPELVPAYSRGEHIGDYYEVYDEFDRITGYVVITKVQGYQSEMKVLVAFDTSKKTKTVIILEQSETPGIGSKITEKEFLQEFIGKKGSSLDLKKYGGTIDSITGATISSSAVAKAVKEADTIIR